MKDIAIYGFGGFGHEVACLIQHINEVEPTWNIVGYFDDGVAQRVLLARDGHVYRGRRGKGDFRVREVAAKLAVDADERFDIVIARRKRLAIVPLSEIPEAVIPVYGVNLGGVRHDMTPVVEEAQSVVREHAVAFRPENVGPVLHGFADKAAIAHAD